jgi:glycosyltransferase involved in cell wall biosynthesis
MSATKPVICHLLIANPTLDVRVFHKQCLSLVKAGYDVSLIGPHPQDEVRDGVVIHALPHFSSRFGTLLKGPWMAYRKLLSLNPRPDVVVFCEPAFLLLGVVMRWRGFKVVYDVRENISLQILTKSWLPRFVRRPMAWLYHVVERITIRGMGTLHVLDSIAKDYPEPKVTVRNLPKLAVEGPRTPRTADEPHRLLYVGGVSEIRGAYTMVRMVAELKRRGIAVRLRIVGPWSENNMQEKLQAEVSSLGVDQEVTATGPMPYVQAVHEVGAADVGLCILHPAPNYLNSLATKILEYMWYEVPVVASDFECWREYVTDVGSGIMVDPFSIEQAADAVQWIIEHPHEAREMGRRGRQAVLEIYNWDAEAGKLVSFYQRLLAER